MGINDSFEIIVNLDQWFRRCHLSKVVVKVKWKVYFPSKTFFCHICGQGQCVQGQGHSDLYIIRAALSFASLC